LKTIFFLLFGLFFSVIANAQNYNFKITYEETEAGEYTIFATNDEYHPISLRLNFKMKNMRLADVGYKIYTVEGKSKQALTSLKVISKLMPYEFSYTYFYNFGNDGSVDYDKDYVYGLPFNNEYTYKVIQGFNGSYSHTGKYAIDFEMPEGSEIMAIRDGIVVRIIDTNNSGCPSIDCVDLNNYVVIYHSDGTFANYSHLMQHGALVEVGEKVMQGQVIGLSGNTGFSSGPHLHLEVFIQRLNYTETLPIKFLLGNGNIDFLEENRYY